MSMHFLKPECPCGDEKCNAIGDIVARTGHSRRCGGACCAKGRQQRENRRNGMKAQNRARRSLGVPPARSRSKLGNEENWRHPWFRFEVKSGKQVDPIWVRFAAAEHQADASKAVGDPRPFVMAAMPDGLPTDGLVIMRLETWRTQIVPVLEADLDGSALLRVTKVER